VRVVRRVAFQSKASALDQEQRKHIVSVGMLSRNGLRNLIVTAVHYPLEPPGHASTSLPTNASEIACFDSSISKSPPT